MNETNKQNETNKDQNKIITRREVARMLQANERTICRWTKQGLFNPVRLPLRKCIKGFWLTDIQTIIADNDVENKQKNQNQHNKRD